MDEQEGVAAYVAGSSFVCSTCCFTSSQSGTTTVHLVGAMLHLTGSINFASAADWGVKNRIQLQTASFASVVLSNVQLFLADSSRLEVKGTFQSKNSTIWFDNGAIRISYGSSLDLQTTNFDGSGNISVDAGVSLKASACSFKKNISLVFDDVSETMIQTFRNVDWQNPTVNLKEGGVSGCDTAGTGVSAGSSHSATQHE